MCVVAMSLLSCSQRSGEQVPEYVYLRTDSVVVSVTVRAEGRVGVGEWLPLKARRTTVGEWKKVAFREVEEGGAWIGYVPPPHEEEVAANLHWYAEPSQGVRFDAWAPVPVPRPQRAVMFARPGRYKLWATSYAPQNATSNVLEIEVVAR